MASAARTLLPLLLGTFLLCTLSCTRSTEVRPARTLHLRLSTNPTTLDPALITDVLSGGIAAKIFNGLIRFNEDLELVPDIAESWTISPDGRTYTFRLRRGVRFSNGRTVISRDFRYSFERVLAPATKAPLTWVLDKIQGADEFIAGKTGQVSGIRCPDDHTLVLSLRKPFGPFLSLLAMTTAYVVPQEDVKRLGQDFGTRPVGTGPFVLAEWMHGQGLMLKAREEYFEGTARISGILYRVIPEDLTAVMEFETGRLDALLIPSSEYRRYRTDPVWSARIHGRPGLNTYYLGLNCTRPPFDDRRVRQAVNLAIDRQRILESVFEKRGVLAGGPVPPGLWKYGRGPMPAGGYPYDPVRAKELIREAGALDTRITLYGSGEPEILDFLEVIKWYLDRAGLEADIRQLDWSAFKSAVNKGEPNAFWLSWWADYPDPENFLYPLFHAASAGPRETAHAASIPGWTGS
jgi:peptide/nickel transport system substrate-binding protein/oligopeptide transport system substrate-binding protein